MKISFRFLSITLIAFGLLLIVSCQSNNKPKVESEENKAIYSEQEADTAHLSKSSAVQEESVKDKEGKTMSKEEKMAMGKTIYTNTCQACHQADGKGLPGAFPPLAESDYFANDPDKIGQTIINGLSGKITVNGKEYNGVMPKQDLSDEEIAAVTTFVLNSFGNKGGEK